MRGWYVAGSAIVNRAYVGPVTGDPAFEVGERVQIRRDPKHGPGPWPAEPTGVVMRHPLSGDGASWRPVETTTGARRFYWIAFDVPQMDTEGDGPYETAEVLDRYLERVTAK